MKLNLNIHGHMESNPYHVTKLNMFNHNLKNCKLFLKAIVFEELFRIISIKLRFLQINITL